MAYRVDPPEEDHPDEGVIICNTECPFSNGQIVCFNSSLSNTGFNADVKKFDSRVGERFHIDCGRRHGVKVISTYFNQV